MPTKSAFSILGLAHKVCLAAEAQGYTPELLNSLAEDKNLFKNLLEVQMGRAEIKPKVHPWTEENGIIRFSVTSDGTSGKDWIKRLEKKGFNIGDRAKQVLKSPDFKPTSGTTEIGVLKGKLFSDSDRITATIRENAKKMGFVKPNAEIACLIREKFTDEDIEAMGLIWIVAMHEPIKDSGGGPNLLGASRFGGGGWLRAGWDRPGIGWDDSVGFAFALPQVKIGA